MEKSKKRNFQEFAVKRSLSAMIAQEARRESEEFSPETKRASGIDFIDAPLTGCGGAAFVGEGFRRLDKDVALKDQRKGPAPTSGPGGIQQVRASRGSVKAVPRARH